MTQDELADLMHLTRGDHDEVVFSKQHVRLKASSTKWVDIILQVSGATNDNIVAFTDGRRIKDSSVSVRATRGEIFKLVAETGNTIKAPRCQQRRRHKRRPTTGLSPIIYSSREGQHTSLRSSLPEALEA
ncbi:hypothetical protein CHS0354_040036 [Potamilus streckersoni]|uniref:Uncharacterized protein n=1 Tax=Potamilus streckersoni TaxID=2493646 RepID=A0AAE0ST45_9BIVA|nr:hypothetical protein CHS0354_040036 [Potamilus streckersoni]